MEASSALFDRDMVITCWGTRGSIPTPAHNTSGYGGNTACITIDLGGKTLVLDAGTGIRQAGQAVIDRDTELYLLLTHIHGDHIYGFPFFGPLYQPKRRIHLIDYQHENTPDVEPWSLLSLLDGKHFPLKADSYACKLIRVQEDAMTFLHSRGIDIQRIAVNHPGHGYGYRITEQNHSVVFMPDNELLPPDGTATTALADFVKFCEGADVLIHDAQYIDTDLPHKWGWGHSMISQVVDLAIQAHVRRLILFHHDPERTDSELDAIQAAAQERLAPHGITCNAAHEGLALTL